MRKEKKRRKNKNKESGDEVSTITTKTKSQLAREARRKKIPSVWVKKSPYPLVSSKHSREQCFAHFLDIFNKLGITIPFKEALQKMPLYTKFIKDFPKGKYVNNENIVVEGNCNAVIQRKLPHKLKDSWNVTIPCSIRNVSVGKAFLALGASINLMPLSMCQRIGNLKIAPTRMTL